MRSRYSFRNYVISTLGTICFFAFIYYVTQVGETSCEYWSKMQAMEFKGVFTKKILKHELYL